MRPLLILAILCGALTLGLWSATQYEASHVPASIRGVPWTTVAGYAVYRPHSLLWWWFKVDSRTRQAMSGSTWILYGACIGGVMAGVVVMKLWRVKKKTLATGMVAPRWVPSMMRDGRSS